MALCACAIACARPVPDDGAELAAVTLSGARVAEQRTWRTEEDGVTRLVQERRWAVRVRGDEVAWRTTLEARLDADGTILDLAVGDGEVLAPWTPPGKPVVWLEEARPALGRAAAGETLTVEAWLPTSSRAVTTTLSPGPGGAVEVDAGLLRAVWTLDDAGVVRARAGAVEIVRVDAFPPASPPDLPALLRLPTEPWPDAASSRHLVVRLDGVAPADLHFPPGQIAGPDGVRVERPLRHEIPAARYARLEALVAEVRGRVRVAPRPGLPDAARALAEGAGDCNEHAAALVALLEADGVPARAVTGWVYADGAVEPGLYPHAWVEADLGEPVGWVPVDPVLGQTIADATHVRARDGVAVLSRPAVTRLAIR